MKKVTHKNKNGFTLVELLVVVAIIAILATLVSPVVKSMQRSGKAAQCMSNLRLIGQAAQLYSGEHDNLMVPLYTPSTELWTIELAPYLGLVASNVVKENVEGSNKIFVCPEAPTRFGYGHNYSYLGWGPTPETTVVYKLNQVDRPSQTVFFVDAINRTKMPPAWPAAVRSPNYGGGRDLDVEFRHSLNRVNVLWLDGHVTAEGQTPLMKDDSLWDRL